MKPGKMKSRRDFLKDTGLVAAALTFGGCGSTYLQGERGRSPSHPNIILMMTDAQGWGATGYYGHPHLKTPA
ncbi:MAG: twin-arginine translocation signal domain-containing protein, partial [Planctomycetota bacterium]